MPISTLHCSFQENQLGCVKVVNFGRSGFPGKKKGVPVKKPLYALVLTPTRELAVQVKNHLQAAAKYTDIYVSICYRYSTMIKQ